MWHQKWFWGQGRWALNQQPILSQDIQLWIEGLTAVLLSKATAPKLAPKEDFHKKTDPTCRIWMSSCGQEQDALTARVRQRVGAYPKGRGFQIWCVHLLVSGEATLNRRKCKTRTGAKKRKSYLPLKILIWPQKKKKKIPEDRQEMEGTDKGVTVCMCLREGQECVGWVFTLEGGHPHRPQHFQA